MRTYTLILILLILGACNCPEKETAPLHASDHPQTLASIYNYYADEYVALTYQAFNIARLRIDMIIEKRSESDKLAIVVDIDETLLDNSPHQALMILSDSNYPYMWNEWCDLATAKPVPGAVDFLKYADQEGFAIFYVSNRKEKFVHESTMKNLTALGFPQVNPEHIMLRLERSETNPDPSDKQARRDQIGVQGYEIVMLIGDNLGDFYTDHHDHKQRVDQLKSYRASFGDRFIILPNAMYGNWPASLGIDGPEALDSLLKEMILPFEELKK